MALLQEGRSVTTARLLQTSVAGRLPYGMDSNSQSQSPSQSPSAGAKKARKKPKAPQQIDEATWLAIEKAVVAGMGFSEASRAVNVHTIIMRSRRDHWPTSSRVEERARLLQASLQRQSEAAQERRNGNDQALEAAAESWAQKAERHRALAFDFAHGALRTASKAPPPIATLPIARFFSRAAS